MFAFVNASATFLIVGSFPEPVEQKHIARWRTEPSLLGRVSQWTQRRVGGLSGPAAGLCRGSGKTGEISNSEGERSKFEGERSKFEGKRRKNSGAAATQAASPAKP